MLQEQRRFLFSCLSTSSAPPRGGRRPLLLANNEPTPDACLTAPLPPTVSLN